MHQQIRCVVPASSAPDVRKPLRILADAGISIAAFGGGGVEHGGEIAITVSHDDHARALDLLAAYHPKVVDVLVCTLVPGNPGELLQCIEDARGGSSPWKNLRIQDITIGTEPDAQGRIPVQIYFKGPR